MERVSQRERVQIMQAAEHTTADHLKRLPQEYKKTLEKVRKNEKLTAKELNVAHHLAEKLEGRFDKYKEREADQTPSTRGEKMIKGIKNLVGARIGSKKLEKNIKQTASQLPSRLPIEGLERAPRSTRKEVRPFDLSKVTKAPRSKRKEVRPLDLSKATKAPREGGKTEFQPRKMPSTKHTQNLMILAGNRDPETQDQMNEYVVKHKSFREMGNIGLENPKFKQKAQDALRFAMDSRELNTTEKRVIQRVLQEFEKPKPMGQDEALLWLYETAGDNRMLADQLVEQGKKDSKMRTPNLDKLVTLIGSKATPESDRKKLLQAYMQLKNDTRTRHQPNLDNLKDSIGLKPWSSAYRDKLELQLQLGVQNFIDNKLATEKCYLELADLAERHPEHKQIARTAFMHAARNEQLPAIERLLAFDYATNL